MERWGTYTFGIGVRPHLRLSLSPFALAPVPICVLGSWQNKSIFSISFRNGIMKTENLIWRCEMRKCIRCGSEMKENCAIKVEGAGYGIILSSDENKLFGGRMGKPKVAICPNCGEVSVYMENIEKRR